MRSFIRVGVVACLGLGLLTACSADSVDKIKGWTANFNSNVAAINESIATVAPTVGAACNDLQFWTGLIEPFAQDGSKKAQQAFAISNGAIKGYCQTVPSDINSTAKAVANAAKQAKVDYDKVKNGG